MKNLSYGFTVQKLGKVLDIFCAHIANYDKYFKIDLRNKKRIISNQDHLQNSKVITI